MQTALVERSDAQSSSYRNIIAKERCESARCETRNERRGGRKEEEGASSKQKRQKLSSDSPRNFSISSFSALVSLVLVDSDEAKEERSMRKRW